MPQERVRFKCLRCGRCCTDPTTIVTVTILDIARIANHLSLSAEEMLSVLGFYQVGDDTPQDQVEKMVTTPVLTERGLAFVGLLKEEDGRCVYFGQENDCTIYTARPSVCRTFPFTFVFIKRIKGDVDYAVKIGLTQKGREWCPGLNAAGTPLIKLVEWKKLGAETLRQMVHHEEFVTRWNAAVQDGAVEGTARSFVTAVLQSFKKQLTITK